MAEKGEVYKCEICGNVVSVLQGGDGDLVCCGEEMVLLNAEEAQKYNIGYQFIGTLYISI